MNTLINKNSINKKKKRKMATKEYNGFVLQAAKESPTGFWELCNRGNHSKLMHLNDEGDFVDLPVQAVLELPANDYRFQFAKPTISVGLSKENELYVVYGGKLLTDTEMDDYCVATSVREDPEATYTPLDNMREEYFHEEYEFPGKYTLKVCRVKGYCEGIYAALQYEGKTVRIGFSSSDIGYDYDAAWADEYNKTLYFPFNEKGKSCSTRLIELFGRDLYERNINGVIWKVFKYEHYMGSVGAVVASYGTKQASYGGQNTAYAVHPIVESSDYWDVLHKDGFTKYQWDSFRIVMDSVNTWLKKQNEASKNVS